MAKVINGTSDNDSISNEKENVIIYGLDGYDTIDNKANNVTISGGANRDYIPNKGSKVSIDGGMDSDGIYNYGSNVTISGGEGNDRIVSYYCSTVSINGDDGNDYLYIESLWNPENKQWDIPNKITINGGAGDDHIVNYGINAMIFGGLGNDTIGNDRSDVSINGGEGNDVIENYGSNVLFTYSEVDGNDIIYGVKSDSTVQIATNNGYTTQKSGNDVIIKVGNGSITFKDGADKSFKISTVPGGNSDTKSDTKKTQQDVIKAFMHSLYETALIGTSSTEVLAALDEAVNYASDGKFESYEKLIENFVRDCKEYSVDEFLKSCCGIDLSNEDTGAITGWDAGGIAVKTAESVVEESGKLQSYKKSFTLPHEKSGLSLVWNAPKKVTAAQKKIVQGLYSWWFKGALDLVTESYSLDFKKYNTINKITLFSIDSEEFFTEDISKIKEYLTTIPALTLPLDENEDGEIEELYIYVNEDAFNNINLSENKNGSDYHDIYSDRIIAHELTHAIMGANVSNYNELPDIVSEGMAELTHGGDFRGVKELATTFHSEENSSKLETSLKGGMSGETDIAYTSGYMLLRYFAKQASSKELNGVHCDSDKTKIILASDYKDTIFNAEDYFSTIKEIDGTSLKSKVKIVGNTLANTIQGGTKNDTLLGGAGADKIYGNGGNDSLYGGDGKDILSGGNGNDTLTGGKGNDVFIYTAGNDVIADYASGDKISLNTSISSSSIKGSDATFKIGSSTLTVKDGKGKEVVFIDAKGDERTIIGGAYLSTDSMKSAVTLSTAWREVGDASERTTAIKLTGNANDNSLLGGEGKDTLYGKDGNDYLVGNDGNDKLYGQNGDDTLWGGKGNDTLTGGEGDDLFIYSDGKDVIADYVAGDRISIGACVTSSSLNGADAVLTFGSNTLTVKNVGHKELTLIDAEGSKLTTIIGGAVYDDEDDVKITLASGIEIGDASERTAAIKITGNANDNSLLGGEGKDTLYGKDGDDYLVGNAGADKLYGQVGNDTLLGCTGNDSLWGDAGADTFLYSSGDGKDIIYGFENSDLLQITGAFNGTYSKSKCEIYFKVDSTSKAITLTDFSATSFNVNGDLYQISGTKLVKK